MSRAENLMAWETAARMKGGAGVWTEGALQTAVLRTPYGEAYGREGFVRAAAARSAEGGDAMLSDAWTIGDGAWAAWSAVGEVRRGDAEVRGLFGGIARFAGPHVVEAWSFDDMEASARADGLSAVEAARRHCVPLLDIGADPMGSQLPPDPGSALPPGLDAAARTVLAGYLSMIVRRRFDRVGEIYAPGAVVQAMGSEPRDPAEANADWHALMAAMPDSAVLPEAAVADEGGAAVLWHLSGCLTAPLHGLPPTGRRLRIPVLSQFRLRDGRILAERRLLDRVALSAAACTPR